MDVPGGERELYMRKACENLSPDEIPRFCCESRIR